LRGEAESPPPRPTDWSPQPDAAALRAAFLRVFPGVVVAMFLAALDQTILASALPAIVASLGGFEDLSWVVVAYLLATTVAAPLYGHLGDRFGRRRMLLAALTLFTAASLACALAPTLWFLIGARALQGLGGGGLMTLSQALISESVPPRERARFQGYFAALFASSSTAGPVLGAVLTQYLSWRAVFFINLPLGILAALLALRITPAPLMHTTRFRPDVPGSVLFALGAVTLLFGLSSAGHRFEFGDWRLYALLAAAVACLFLFVLWERRVDDPVVPVRLIATPVMLRSNGVVMAFAAALFSSVIYMPLYLQLGRGAGIGLSGLLLVPLTLSIALSALVTGRRIAHTGELTRYPTRGLMLATAAFLALGASVHVAPTWAVLVLIMLAGGGLGAVMPPMQIIVQTAGGQHALARAVASMSVARAMGGALGVAIVGALVFVLIGRHDKELASVLPRIAESGGAFLDTLPQAQRLSITARLDSAFRIVFLLIAGITGAGALLASRVPTQRL
jgi:EmrB/QacA subfamily drug resistance transporter